jgi:hypothetical protein
MPGVPQRVRWTDHPYVKAGLLGAARADIEQAIIEHHQDRQSNPGATQWRLSMGYAVETIDDYDFHPPNDLRRFRVPIVGVRHLDDTAFVADVRYGDVVLRHYAFADRWYKINITTDLDGELIETAGSGDVPAFAFNCDIATPMVRDTRSVLAVDLWLDVLVGADGVTCDVRDEDDFAAAIEHGWLSEREAAGALAGLRELLELTERNQLVSMLTAVCPFGVGRVPAALPADTVPTSTVPQLHPFVRMSW